MKTVLRLRVNTIETSSKYVAQGLFNNTRLPVSGSTVILNYYHGLVCPLLGIENGSPWLQALSAQIAYSRIRLCRPCKVNLQRLTPTSTYIN